MNREGIGALKICAGMYEAPHDQRFFRVLILLKIILYSKYESRYKRAHEGLIVALLKPSKSSGSNSSIDTVKSTFNGFSSEG